MPCTHQSFGEIAWRDGTASPGSRVLAEETAVAISYNGSTHAVLMATPADLDDLAVGFSLTEGIVDDMDAIESVTIVEFPIGMDAQVRVREDVAERLARRRRSMAGPVGCGICGLESLEAVARDIAPVAAATAFRSQDIVAAVGNLTAHQPLNKATGAVHAAAFFEAGATLGFVREDVGRHNALDKVIGAMARARRDPSRGGFVVTSRVSVELVQKAAMAGCGLIAAISAPTALAIRVAETANITVAAVVRGDSFEVFGVADRIKAGAMADVV